MLNTPLYVCNTNTLIIDFMDLLSIEMTTKPSKCGHRGAGCRRRTSTPVLAPYSNNNGEAEGRVGSYGNLKGFQKVFESLSKKAAQGIVAIAG